MTDQIRFDDGANYERYMGVWSRLVGERFVDWLGIPAGKRWLDIGCGNGAFTELLLARSCPAAVAGIDPSAPQLEYARKLPALADVDLRLGDAQELPFADHSFDVAVMPLVLFFVPDPARGVAEMQRVVERGGWVAAYAWDMPGGGFPYEPVREAVIAMGIEVPAPPSPHASSQASMQALWQEAGLGQLECTTISVQRRYADLEDYWQTLLGAPSIGARLAALADEQQKQLRAQLPDLLHPAEDGSITCSGLANAVKGRV
ncbi:MAG: methyltransferase domain-containing protein [Xanthomonadales bacterium]|nr:methyltransferase domain-containing protein [Xanthomonadales bacterium]